jgi:hypothetical protein
MMTATESRRFHDALLDDGPLPLTLLEAHRRVDRRGENQKIRATLEASFPLERESSVFGPPRLRDLRQ